MNEKQKLTALVLALSLSAGSTALAYSGAPASQFGFRGWPYRQSNRCTESKPTRQPQSTPDNMMVLNIISLEIFILYVLP